MRRSLNLTTTSLLALSENMIVDVTIYIYIYVKPGQPLGNCRENM